MRRAFKARTALHSMFTGLADNSNPRSLASLLRRRRLALFSTLLSRLPEKISILDIGGTPGFWQLAPMPHAKSIQITLLNLERLSSSQPSIRSLTGDARLLPVRDRAFDVVFSNSVIEHVGGPNEQRRMAEEIRRVGQRYFVQTPNRNFPVEPHFLFPFYQFLPETLQVWLLRSFDLGWFRRTPDPARARRAISGIRLLGHREVSRLFPEAEIYEEKFLGLTKSFVAHWGW